LAIFGTLTAATVLDVGEITFVAADDIATRRLDAKWLYTCKPATATGNERKNGSDWLLYLVFFLI
jgi:hypothetical protein